MRLAIIFILLFRASLAVAQPFIEKGHAHNDYIHKRPLHMALENGFASIEIDIFLHYDELIVSHIPVALNSKPKIQSLYLDPLKTIIDKNGGWVYADSKKPVVLMIDFKTEGNATYQKLKEVLKPYEAYLTKYVNGEKIQGPLEIVISGSKPHDVISSEKERFVTLDVGYDTVKDHPENQAIGRASSSYGSYFKWKGCGEMPEHEKKTLEELVAIAHSSNVKCRFWAIPDKPKVWKALLDAGVDWINTDKLKKFSQFYIQYQKDKP